MRAYVAAILGIVSATIGTTISFLNETAKLPGVLADSTTLRRLSSVKALSGIPAEYFILIWFVFALWATTDNVRRGRNAVDRTIYWTALMALGLCGGLLYRVGLNCVPITVSTLCTVVLWADAAWHSRSANSAGIKSIRTEWAAVLATPRTLPVVITSLAMIVVVGQYISLKAASTAPLERDGQLARWYALQPRIESEGLTAPGKIRVVVFSDYQCPGCSFQVPEYEKVIARYQLGGHPEVELVRRDFPLHPDCNGSVQVRMHPAACSAAAAVRLVAEKLGQEAAVRLGNAFYSRHGRLTPADVGAEMERLQLGKEFTVRLDSLLAQVRKDGEAGGRLGISGTPTAFIDGRLVRSLQPAALEALINFNLEKTHR